MDLAAAVLAGDRLALARAITLVESRRAEDATAAEALLLALHGRGQDSTRIGISGPPGVGKSTFIDAFGTWLTARGHRVAVLAIDPSSARTGGSILGDKTRMQRLGRDPRAFVRPSPASGALGGVTTRTREAIAVCEGAGYGVILVETVGVGQSEIAVADMVDFLLLLVQPDTGDELQGMKRGITEVADAVFVNKADGPARASALRTCAEYQQALSLLHGSAAPPRVFVGSARDDDGLQPVWTTIAAGGSAARAARRARQAGAWLDAALHELLVDRFLAQPAAAAGLAAAQREVARGDLPPPVAARRLLRGDGAGPPTAAGADAS